MLIKQRFVNTRTMAAVAAAILGAMSIAACSTAPRSVEGKADLRQDTSETLVQVQKSDASMEKLIEKSAGYAVFPQIAKAREGDGGAYGKGDVYEKGLVVGYCDMKQASSGFKLDGQAYTEILVFENAAAIEKFKSSTFELDGKASAVALTSGSAATAQFANGVAVFTMDEDGTVYKAAIGGQKFRYQGK